VGGIVAVTDINSFNDRLSRINSGKQWVPEGVVHQTAHQRQGRNGVFARLFRTISLPMAFGIGVVSVIIARWTRFAIYGLQSPGADVAIETMLIDGVLAMALGFVIGQMTALKSASQMLAKGFGVTACVVGMHLLVHRAPDLFTELFSPEWVNQIITSTDRNGILFLSFPDLPF